jgi:hypothetical protein
VDTAHLANKKSGANRTRYKENMKKQQNDYIKTHIDKRWVEYMNGLHSKQSLVRCLDEDEKRLGFYRNLYQLQAKMFEGVVTNG